uniref:exo-alpha-sialidase n=1 Tax=Neogobius melanostomus TaxID=47308 RepID=A0A8C6WKJ3_9GOBI
MFYVSCCTIDRSCEPVHNHGNKTNSDSDSNQHVSCYISLMQDSRLEGKSVNLSLGANILPQRETADQASSTTGIQELQSATLRDYCPMNPCPVYEKNSKTVFLFFICVLGNTTEKWQICTGENKTRLCYVTSGDNGQTWSEVRDLTESVIGETIHNWATFAVGPGHGVQLENGRLIIPAYAYYIPCRCFSYPIPYTVHPRALSIYSEDEGRTWCLGKMLSKHSCECEMAEIIDHEGRSHLYCNARHTSYRWEALSGDSGASFYEPRCQGSVIGFPAPKHDTQTWLLFMHPTSTTGRSDMGVYLNRSPLHSSKWEEPKIIHTGPSGYSDLAYNGDKGTFSGLMECGKETELENAFVTFTMYSKFKINKCLNHTSNVLF